MLQGTRLEPRHHSTSAVRLEDGVLISAVNWPWRRGSTVGGSCSTQQEHEKASWAFHAGFFFFSPPLFFFFLVDLLTRFTRLSVVLGVFRVQKDALWVSAEPCSHAPAKLNGVPFHRRRCKQSGRDSATLFFFSLPLKTSFVSSWSSFTCTNVLRPLNVHGGASRRVRRAPRTAFFFLKRTAFGCRSPQKLDRGIRNARAPEKKKKNPNESKRRAGNDTAAGLERHARTSDPSAALATEVHCEVQKRSDKEEEENEGQTRGSLLETH